LKPWWICSVVARTVKVVTDQNRRDVMSNGVTPKRKDVLMLQATSALTRGSGGAELTEDAFAWFHSHYYEWIDTPKKSAEANGRSPQDVWGEQWRDFAQRFGEIGRRAAAAAGKIEAKTLEEYARAVERESDCPWCPDKE
jgi:hypothetical protein